MKRLLFIAKGKPITPAMIQQRRDEIAKIRPATRRALVSNTFELRLKRHLQGNGSKGQKYER